MISEEIDVFKKIVRDLLSLEFGSQGENAGQPIKCELPWSFFSSSVCMLKRGKSLSKSEIGLLAKEFLLVLDQNAVRMDEKKRKKFLAVIASASKKKKRLLSYALMAGARAAQVRHDGVLKYDQ